MLRRIGHLLILLSVLGYGTGVGHTLHVLTAHQHGGSCGAQVITCGSSAVNKPRTEPKAGTKSTSSHPCSHINCTAVHASDVAESSDPGDAPLDDDCADECDPADHDHDHDHSHGHDCPVCRMIVSGAALLIQPATVETAADAIGPFRCTSERAIPAQVSGSFPARAPPSHLHLL